MELRECVWLERHLWFGPVRSVGLCMVLVLGCLVGVGLCLVMVVLW